MGKLVVNVTRLWLADRRSLLYFPIHRKNAISSLSAVDSLFALFSLERFNCPLSYSWNQLWVFSQLHNKNKLIRHCHKNCSHTPFSNQFNCLETRMHKEKSIFQSLSVIWMHYNRLQFHDKLTNKIMTKNFMVTTHLVLNAGTCVLYTWTGYLESRFCLTHWCSHCSH